MTVKPRVSGVSTSCGHASPSTMYTHSTAAEAECQGEKKHSPVGCTHRLKARLEGVATRVLPQEDTRRVLRTPGQPRQ
eukprot:2716374-Pyramimonas_sp.AAC.3